MYSVILVTHIHKLSDSFTFLTEKGLSTANNEKHNKIIHTCLYSYVCNCINVHNIACKVRVY